MGSVSTFWVSTRKSVFQVRFIVEDGGVIAMRSRREATSERAVRKLAKVLIPEIEAAPAKKSAFDTLDADNPDCLYSLNGFWQDETGCGRSRLLRCVSMSRFHVENPRKLIERHARRYLEGKRIRSVGPDTLESMIFGLSGEGAGPRVVGMVIQANWSLINQW